MEQREQCELAQTLPSRDRGRRSQITEITENLPKDIDKMTDQELAVWYNDNVIYPDKVRINLYYLDHYSFFKDIQMIFCTVLGKKYVSEE